MQPRGRSWRTQFYHVRTKGGIPPDLEWEAHYLRTEQSVFWRKGDLIVQVWMDKDLTKRSTICDAKVVKAGRKDRRADLEIKKLRVLSVQYIHVGCR